MLLFHFKHLHVSLEQLRNSKPPYYIHAVNDQATPRAFHRVFLLLRTSFSPAYAPCGTSRALFSSTLETSACTNTGTFSTDHLIMPLHRNCPTFLRYFSQIKSILFTNFWNHISYPLKNFNRSTQQDLQYSLKNSRISCNWLNRNIIVIIIKILWI